MDNVQRTDDTDSSDRSAGGAAGGAADGEATSYFITRADNEKDERRDPTHPADVGEAGNMVPLMLLPPPADGSDSSHAMAPRTNWERPLVIEAVPMPAGMRGVLISGRRLEVLFLNARLSAAERERAASSILRAARSGRTPTGGTQDPE